MEWEKEKEYSEVFFDECAFTKKLSPEQCQYAIDYFSKFIRVSIKQALESQMRDLRKEVELLRKPKFVNSYTTQDAKIFWEGKDSALDEVLTLMKK